MTIAAPAVAPVIAPARSGNPLNPAYLIDAYKIDHRRMYPANTQFVYSNLTPRGSRIPGIDKVVFFGLQCFLDRILGDMFDEWFATPEDEVVAAYERRTNGVVGPNEVGGEHIRALHRLGYVPLRFSALPEGTEVPMQVPMFVLENTDPEFFWVTNYIETVLSAETWMPATTATLALHMRRLLDGWAEKTSSAPGFVDFQGHDFSFRGMSSLESAAASGAGHLLSFAGTDTMVSLDWIERYYPVEGERFLGGSVPATEHSVMSAGGFESEQQTFERLLDLYPSGIVSVVSDTWDLWKVLTEMLPAMKDRVMARDGKLVIRPDSGDPADIICGDPNAAPGTPEAKGVIELLWDTFGGEVNDKGYRELDAHVGAIYGDSITYDRAEDICKRLAEKGFASTSVIFGVGSFSYQYNTRDTFGFAMKATWAQIDGEGHDLFKNPVTDNGTKRSAKGRLAVHEDAEGNLVLTQGATEDQEATSLLQPVWENGKFIKRHTWNEVVDRLGVRVLR